MKRIALSLAILFSFSALWAQKQYRKEVRPSKNVILMIPDGTSPAVYTAARWFKDYNGRGRTLAVDPYFCGTVLTYCSNAPIGDSAPTTSCYMTGVPQQAGNVSTYPVVHENDLIPLDSTRTYQPLATILEASKYYQQKATGIVATVLFAHATPADCAAHYYNRNKYDILSSQMAYNNLDVVIASGNKYITDDIKQHFKNTNTTLIQDDIKAFRNYKGKNSLWALFEENELPFDLDRNTLAIPSLAEMTDKAIKQLAQNENGFFLMVEGSQVDWAAHGNDPAAVITEYIAFDDAVQVAMDFALKDGETTIVILTDHGTGGITIGRSDLKGYAKASLKTLFGNVSKYKKSASGLAGILEKTEAKDLKDIFKEYTDIELTEEEFNTLSASLGHNVPEDYMQVANTVNPSSAVAKIMTEHTYFGFTTGGHTGEEALLAVYHPQGDIPTGMNTNIEINQYLFDVSGLEVPLLEMSDQMFAKHTEVFAGMNCTIDKSGEFPALVINKGENTLRVPAYTSVAYLNDKPVALHSVVVYVDKNDIFYLPKNLAEILN